MIIISHWRYARWWFFIVMVLPFFIAFGIFTFWLNYVLANIAAGTEQTAITEKTFMNPFCSIVILGYAGYSLLCQVL